MTKSEIRQDIRRLKAACRGAEREALSRAAAARVASHPQWQQASTVVLYHPLPDEVDTRGLIRLAAEEGRRVLLPVVAGDDLELRLFRSEADLREGAFHILEPCGAAFTDWDAVDLAVVPGVAFTPGGQRLGRGRGYYDRLLPRLSRAYRMGLCWPFQLVPSLPAEDHDVAMHEVVSA